MDQSIENICRVCLNVQDTVFSLYRARHGCSPYEKLARRTPLRVHLHDAGPASICSQCLIDLDSTVAFLDRCERSNRLLAERFVQGIDDATSNGKAEAEPSPEPESKPPEAVEVVAREDKPESVALEEERCGECGARRRCAHWSPPAQRVCPFCQKTFKKKYNYQIHVNLHLGESNFSCSVCGAGQLSRWGAARHCRAAARRACPAPGCGRSFTTTTNLQTHIRKHNGEKPFECDDCGKRFISKNILNNHMRIHTGVKPYMCQVCGAQFATNKLAAHLAAHAAPPARPHACARAHCPRAFRTARDLRQHARAHQSERQYLCAVCDCSYKYKQSLNHHVRSAHGINKDMRLKCLMSGAPSEAARALAGPRGRTNLLNKAPHDQSSSGRSRSIPLLPDRMS